MDLAYKADTTIKNIKCFDFKTFDDLKVIFKDSPEKIQKYTPRENCSFKVAIQLPKPMNYRITKYLHHIFMIKKQKLLFMLENLSLMKVKIFLNNSLLHLRLEKDGSEKKRKAYNIFSYIAVIIKEIDVNKSTFVQVSKLEKKIFIFFTSS